MFLPLAPPAVDYKVSVILYASYLRFVGALFSENVKISYMCNRETSSMQK